MIATISFIRTFLLLLQADADRQAHASLEEALQVVADRVGVAATEAETVALHRRQERIDGAELVAGRGRAGLAQLRPGVKQVAIAAPLDDGSEALLPVRRNPCGPRYRRQ